MQDYRKRNATVQSAMARYSFTFNSSSCTTQHGLHDPVEGNRKKTGWMAATFKDTMHRERERERESV